MLERIQGFIEEIEEYNIEERCYHKRVRPEFLTHDEICYHIESVVALDVHHGSGVQEFVFYEEKAKEIIGEELDIDLEDFIDFDTIDPAYERAVVQMKGVLNQLK